MSINTQLQITSNFLTQNTAPVQPPKKGLFRRSGTLVKKGVESRVYKEIVWSSVITGKSAGFFRHMRNLGLKLQQAFKPMASMASDVTAKAIPAGAAAIQGASRFGSVSQLLLKITRSLFIFKIPKTVYDFVKHCVELSKHKQEGRRYETKQAALGLVDSCGDMVGYSADAAGALLAFNAVNAGSIAWASPVAVVGAVFNAAGVAISSLQLQETCRFYEQMNKVAQKAGRKHYELEDLVQLYSMIKEKELVTSERFTARQFMMNPKNFHAKLKRIVATVEQCKKGSAEKLKAANVVSDRVVKGLKQRVSTRMVTHVLSICAGVTGIFASICLGAFVFAAPAVVLAMAIAGLSLLITSFGLTISKMIYERVEQNRLNKVFNQAIKWADQVDPKNVLETIQESQVNFEVLEKQEMDKPATYAAALIDDPKDFIRKKLQQSRFHEV